MRKQIVAIIAFMVLVPLFAFSGSESYNGVGFARMSYVKGDVYIQRGQNLGYEQGEINLALTEGDKLGSRDGQAEIQIGNRNYLRINSNTQLDVVALPNDSSDVIKLHLLSGSIYLRVNELGSEKGIEVHTPDASYYILDRGLYRVDVRENRETEISVFEGSAEAALEQGSQVVKGGERLMASNGTAVSGPAGFNAGAGDEFSRFNESRDAVFAKRSTRSYLPSELDQYQEELDNNGRWTNEQPYGNVWVPNVNDSDWAPYSYGRWDWYPMAGWTWISSEPWGWSTYHYGRWHWRFGLGWYWIPTSIWGPGWVDWCWGNDYVGWSPLSYYNTPGVILNNRFYDRFHGRDYPLNSRALRVVHRDHLQSPNVYRHALAGDRVQALGRVSLGHEQPNIRPLTERVGLNRSLAEKTLDRSNLRGVGRTLTPSGLRPSTIKSGMQNNLRAPQMSQGNVRDRSTVREFPRNGTTSGLGPQIVLGFKWGSEPTPSSKRTPPAGVFHRSSLLDSQALLRGRILQILPGI